MLINLRYDLPSGQVRRFRRSVLLTPNAGALDDQRRSFEQRLAEADGAEV